MSAQNGNAVPEGGEPWNDGPYASDAALLEAIRAGDRAALRLIFIRFSPFLREQAYRMGVSVDERDEVVTTLLDDFVLALFEGERPPRELTRYLLGALRNRIRNRHRARVRRQARHEGASVDAGGAGERVVAECHSEYGIRSIGAPTLESRESLRSAVEKLAEHSAAVLSNEERALMIGISYHVPLRELAAEAGISYGAARVRVHRLRERFLKLAAQHVTTLAPEERHEIERFFRRASVDLSSMDDARRQMLGESGSRMTDRSKGRHNGDDVD